MNGEIRSHRDLKAWQAAFELGLRIYEVTENFPQTERFGLTSQVCRAAVSVASNIAEGYGRGTKKDYLRFLRMARGSVYEIDTQLCFALRLLYIEKDEFDFVQEKINTVGKILAGLIRSIEQSEKNP